VTPDDAPAASEVVRAFALPGSPERLVPAVGGWSNRVFRLDTTRGSYAVKELRNAWGEPRWRDWLDEGWRVELAARHTGIAVPEPVPNPVTGAALAEVERGDGSGTASVRVHRWVDSVAVRPEPVAVDLGRWVGGALAALHACELRPLAADLYRGRVGLTTADVWPELVARSSTVDAPWTADLVRGESLARRASSLLGTWDADDEVLCHGDVDQKNLLLGPEGPLLCDWDVVLPRLPCHDLAEAALSLASWRAPDVAAAVIGGYRDAGGVVDRLGPLDLGPSLASRLGWIRFTVDRGVDACRAGSGTVAGIDVPDVVGLLADLEHRVGVAENLRRWLT
jgi:Ser/Thr protein kinase RdoA (MazF antagonist)